MDKANITFSGRITLNEYHFLRRAAGWISLESEQAKNSLNHSLFLTAARENGKAVGLARLVGDGAYYILLADVIVLPDYQRKGIGSTMVNQCLSFLQKRLKKGQRFSVFLSAAKGKEAFYEKLGFQTYPNALLGYGMGKILSAQ